MLRALVVSKDCFQDSRTGVQQVQLQALGDKDHTRTLQEQLRLSTLAVVAMSVARKLQRHSHVHLLYRLRIPPTVHPQGRTLRLQQPRVLWRLDDARGSRVLKPETRLLPALLCDLQLHGPLHLLPGRKHCPKVCVRWEDYQLLLRLVLVFHPRATLPHRHR
ncbi:hypothetical protein BC629DRAFT_671895 [Irpex lacteus]|nr:hypothetical protein BC629DRAFT_671895 [Irpex lacteus]